MANAPPTTQQLDSAAYDLEANAVAQMLEHALSRSLLELLSATGRAAAWRDRKALAVAPLRLLLERCMSGPDAANEERWWWQHAHDILAVAALTLQNMRSERTELLTSRMLESVEARARAAGGANGRLQLAQLRGRILGNSPV